MKRWWIVLALMLSVGVNLGLLVGRFAPSPAGSGPAGSGPAGPPVELLEEPPDPPRFGPEDGDRLPPPFLRAVEELGLEGEDREAFLALQRRFFLSTSKGRRDAHRLQGELRAQLMAAEPDRAEVDRLQGELAAAHAALERAFVENLLDTRELLDGEAEQRYMRWMARMHRQGEPRGPGERGMDREGFRRRMEERRRR